MDEEIVFEGGLDDGILRAVERISQALDKELNSGVLGETADNKKTTLHTISLYSDEDEDDDNDSLENEMQELRSSQQLLQTELNQVSSEETMDASNDDSDDDGMVVAQHVMDDDLYLRIHDRLPLVDEFKVDRFSIRKKRSSPRSHFSGSRPDPPSQESRPLMVPPPDPTDDNSEGERQARNSQLPLAEEAKSRPRVAFDPEDPLSASERHARISQLPSAKELRKRLRAQDSRKHRRCRMTMLISFLVVLLVVLAIVLPIMLLDDKERTNEVINFLVQHGISKWEDLQNPATPQHKAAQWIADRDGLRVEVSTKHAFMDRYVLAVLFYALGGDTTWPDDLNFLAHDHVCTWVKEQENPLESDLTMMGVHGCQNIDGELVPIGIALGKWI
jgi:hypothetical protein